MAIRSVAGGGRVLMLPVVEPILEDNSINAVAGSSNAQGQVIYKVVIEGREEEVLVDPNLGPIIKTQDGADQSISHIDNWHHTDSYRDGRREHSKNWRELSTSEKKYILIIAAKKSQKQRDWQDSDRHWKPQKAPGFEMVPDFMWQTNLHNTSEADVRNYFEAAKNNAEPMALPLF